MKFKCPNCGHERVECVQSGCMVTTQVVVQDEEVVYLNSTADVNDGIIERFQCINCGWTVPVATDESPEEALVNWLKNQTREST